MEFDNRNRDLRGILAHIFSLQQGIPGLITGLYLDDSDINLILTHLTQDDPVEGALGRYGRYPVYSKAETAISPSLARMEFDSIVFTYYPMSAVD